SATSAAPGLIDASASLQSPAAGVNPSASASVTLEQSASAASASPSQSLSWPSKQFSTLNGQLFGSASSQSTFVTVTPSHRLPTTPSPSQSVSSSICPSQSSSTPLQDSVAPGLTL